MRHLNVKYAAASNFLCFGPDGVEFDFSKMGRIVQVTGEHLDIMEEDGKPANNGCGKSSIPDVISYALTGKTVKPGLKHDNLINNREKKKLYAEVRVDDYRIVRTRKPDTLRVWKSPEGLWTDETEISCGGIPATQKLIDKELGLTHEALANLIFFTDDNRGSFLECDTKQKREIVENMLSLEKYREYCENTKKRKKLLTQKVKQLSKEYGQTTIELTEALNRLHNDQDLETVWKKGRKDELQSLVAKIKEKQNALKSSDVGVLLVKYQEAQTKIAELTKEIDDRESKRLRLTEAMDEARGKLDVAREARQKHQELLTTHASTIRSLQETIVKNEGLIKTTKEKAKSPECPWCFGPVDEKNFHNFVLKATNEIEACNTKLASAKDSLLREDAEVKKYTGYVEKITKGIESANTTLQSLNSEVNAMRAKLGELARIKEPKVGQEELLIEAQIDELKKQAFAKQDELDGPSPYAKIIERDQEAIDKKQAEADSKKAAVAKAEADIPYYDYYLKAFGDNGIRKFVVRDVLPALNNRIAYWLQYLIENRLSLKFDDELEVTIERNPSDGDPFVYHALSRGQQRRLNLAVQQAFAYVMMITSGTSPSFIFLDEVSSNIDPAGIHNIYDMICELAKNKQVFVTTHSSELVQLLDGCDTIKLQMKDGITKVIND